MYIQYRNLKLIEMSGRPDEDNKAILRGDYLNKATQKTENGQEIPFLMPDQDDMMKYIFSDWQKGDILIIADSPLSHPKLQGDTLVEMTKEEICQSGDLTILSDGEIYENGIIKTIPKIDGIKVVWQYPNWVEIATLEEQLEYYKQEMLSVTKELLVYKETGFDGRHLETKYQELLKKHNEISQELANQENNFPAKRTKRSLLYNV